MKAIRNVTFVFFAATALMAVCVRASGDPCDPARGCFCYETGGTLHIDCSGVPCNGYSDFCSDVNDYCLDVVDCNSDNCTADCASVVD